MATTFVYCADCGHTQPVTITLTRWVDGTGFYEPPQSVTFTAVERHFGCGHIETMWDAIPSAYL